jgi:hypothetical protein
MNATDRTTRLLQTWLESEAPQQVPAGLLDRIDTATRARTPRALWLARLEGHHMDLIEGGRRSVGVPRLGLILAIVGLVIAGAVTIWVVGHKPTNTVVTPTASADANHSPGPSFKGLAQPVQPGGSLPDEVIGTWFSDGGEYVYYLRAGDPFCVQVWHIATQDCLVYYSDQMGGLQRSADVVTLVDGNLHYHSIGDQGCKGQDSTASYRRVGDVLTFGVTGGCFTSLQKLTLIGTSGAPASAPPLPVP